MMINAILSERLHEMEKIAQYFELPPFDIYLLGGSALVLGGYSSRATRDIDFINLDYPATYGRAFAQLRDYDMLDYESTFLAPYYQDRATKLVEFEYLNICTLSIEDIILSKLVRMDQKDLEDFDLLLPKANLPHMFTLLETALNRSDLFIDKKTAVLNNLDAFKERYHV